MSLYPGHCEMRCIFYADFHPKAGSRIVYQSPTGYVERKVFDSVTGYIITKPQLHGKLITVNAHGYRFLGVPSCLDNPKYERNALMFNFVMVFDADSDTSQYERVARKLSLYMTALERECGYLNYASTNVDSKSTELTTSGNSSSLLASSSGSQGVSVVSAQTESSSTSDWLSMQDLLNTLRSDFNSSGVCEVTVNDSTLLHLEVMPLRRDPPEVEPFDVPIVTPFAQKFVESAFSNQWCPTIKQLLPYIDGRQTVLAIATQADMEANIVRTCLQSLLYYDAVRLISVFQYSNEYVATPDVNRLLTDCKLREDCLSYIACGHRAPSIRDAVNLYCKLRTGTTIRALCARYSPQKSGIDEAKLIQFGLLHGLIRRLHKYPVLLSNQGSRYIGRHYMADDDSSTLLFDGCHNYDEICCRFDLSAQELDERIEKDPNIIVLYK